METKTNTQKGMPFLIAGAVTSCALWGISTPIVKLGYDHINAENIPSLILWAGIEFLIAGFMIWLFADIKAKKLILPKKKSLLKIGTVSAFQTVLQYTCIYIGMNNTSSVKCAILKSTDVFFIMLFASLVLKQEKLTVKKLVACIIGFLGIILVNLNGLRFEFNLSGDGVVILGIVFYSMSVVLIRSFTQSEDPLTLCCFQMALGGVVMIITGLAFGGTMQYLKMLPIIMILAVIYAVSYGVWTVLLQKYPASKVSVFGFTTPIFGVVSSAVILNESGSIPIVNLVVALILVCGGIILQSKSND